MLTPSVPVLGMGNYFLVTWGFGGHEGEYRQGVTTDWTEEDCVPHTHDEQTCQPVTWVENVGPDAYPSISGMSVDGIGRERLLDFVPSTPASLLPGLHIDGIGREVARRPLNFLMSGVGREKRVAGIAGMSLDGVGRERQLPDVVLGSITFNTEATVLDTYMYQLEPDTTQEHRTHQVRNTTIGDRFPLFKFPNHGISAGSTIISGLLRVRVDSEYTGALMFLYAARIIPDFVETEATWNSRATGVPWTVPGAIADTDYTVQGLSVVAGGEQPGDVRVFNVKDLLQRMIDQGDTDFKMLIYCVNVNPSLYLSRIEQGFGFPELTVTYVS